MEPRQITNLAEVTQIDGVYIYDFAPPGFVQGVGAQSVGICGDFERGPVGTVVSIGSSAEYSRIFGAYGAPPPGEESTWRGYSGHRAISGKTWPAPLFVVRCQRDGMAKASLTRSVRQHVAPEEIEVQGRNLIITARDHGNYGNRIVVSILPATDASLDDGFAVRVTLDDRAEFIDNLHPDLTTAQLNALIDGRLTIVTLQLVDSNAAGAPSLPVTANLTAGSDGTPTLQGWTDAVDLLLSRRELNILAPAQPDGTTVTHAALNTYIKGVVAPASGTQPLVIAVLSGPPGDDVEDAATAAATLRSDRIVYTWPYRRQIYPQAADLHQGGILLVPSNDVVAAALANIDPVFDPASDVGSRFVNAATAALEFEFIDRDDYIHANRNGVSALEFDPDLGFRIVNGITTSLVPAQEMIHRRRLADYLNRSVARFLKFYQNQPITQPWKDEVVGAVTGFLENEKKTRNGIQRVIDYQVDIDSVNDSTTESQGRFNILMRVRTPASARFIVLLAQVGSTVQISNPDLT
jgi:hypothetical protein